MQVNLANVNNVLTISLSKWKWPEIPGLFDFKGKLLHSAKW